MAFYVLLTVIVVLVVAFAYWFVKPLPKEDTEHAFFKDLLKRNKIPYTQILSISSLLIDDYTDALFREVKEAALNGTYDKTRYQKSIDLQKPHLYFHLVDILPRQKYVVAIVYHPGTWVLWITEASAIKDLNFLRQLATTNVHRVDSP